MNPKQLVGVVVSSRSNQTAVVRVVRLVRHPVYQKVIRRAKGFKVHDPERKAQVGDEVRIEATRPFSKEKHWRMVEILRKGPATHDGLLETVSEGTSMTDKASLRRLSP